MEVDQVCVPAPLAIVSDYVYCIGTDYALGYEVLAMSDQMTAAEYQATAPKGKQKYGAVRTTVDGITFASKAEASRYVDLKRLQEAGGISMLVLQPKYPIEINGTRVCFYQADFSYIEGNEVIIEDTKGFRTPVYKLKRKMMKAQYGIEIRETS